LLWNRDSGGVNRASVCRGMQSFERLRVWHLARQLANAAYDATDDFPDAELFGLTAQLRRAAVSIAANVAEGASRFTSRDFARFIEIAIGSANEVHCLALIATDRGYLAIEVSSDLIARVRQLRAQLVRLRQRVRPRDRKP